MMSSRWASARRAGWIGLSLGKTSQCGEERPRIIERLLEVTDLILCDAADSAFHSLDKIGEVALPGRVHQQPHRLPRTIDEVSIPFPVSLS